MNEKKAETILVADDEPGMLELIVTILTEQGYEVISAVDGEEALNLFCQHQEQLNLVMLDAMMPKKNGKEVFQEIRRLKPEMKTLFISGWSGQLFNMDDMKDRNVYFLQKPVFPSAIVKKIRAILDGEKS